MSNKPAKLSTPALHPRDKLVFAGLFLLALVVRLIRLGYAHLWTDELLFIGLANIPLNPWQTIALHYQQFPAIGHFPLPAFFHNIFLWVVHPLVPDIANDPFWQRMPAVLWGSAAVPLIFFLGRRVLNERAAWLAAAFMCFFVYPVFFSREAYYYAPLLALSILALHLTFRLITQPAWRGRDLLWLATVLGSVSYAHPSGVLLPITLLVCSLGLLAARKVRPACLSDLGPQRVVLQVAGCALIGILVLLPFYLRRLQHPGQQGLAGGQPVADIVTDLFGKLFIGVHPFGLSIVALLLAAGFAVWLGRGPRPGLRRLMAASTLLLFVLLLVGVLKTQYASRYFMLLCGPFYLTVAAGLDALVGRLLPASSRVGRLQTPVLVAAAGALVAYHLTCALPRTFALKTKCRDYARMAEWLNQHLEPGQPYLMESAYELRWVGGYFKTPGLVPACPYVHGDLKVLQQMQMDFMRTFPEAPFVESAQHGLDQGQVWTWPHQYFRRHAELFNPDLERLERLGLYPQFHARSFPEIEYRTRIWYNTRDDIRAIAREQGMPSFFFARWQCQAVGKNGPATFYMRVMAGRRGVIEVVNDLGRPLRGSLVIQGALAGPAGKATSVLSYQGQQVGSTSVSLDQRMELKTDVLEIPAGTSELEWSASAGPVQALLLDHVAFVPETSGR